MKLFTQNGSGRARRLASRAIWMLVAVVAVVGSATLMRTNPVLSSGGTPGDRIFLHTGVGDKTFLVAGTASANTGSKACIPGKPVEVLAVIAGGQAGNSIHVEATCGGVVVASTTAFDPGHGFATGVQIVGDGECHVFPSRSSGVPSEWIAKCHFYNN